MYLVTNIRTIGYPHPELPLAHPDQPLIRQISAIVFDREGKEIDSVSAPAQLADLTASAATTLNDITVAQSRGEYVHPGQIFSWFKRWADACEIIVGHNVHFDLHAIRVLGARLRDIDWIPRATIYCTMINAASVLQLPPTAEQVAVGKMEPRAPTLSECIRFFFNEDLRSTVDGLADVRASMRLFQRLQSDWADSEASSIHPSYSQR